MVIQWDLKGNQRVTEFLHALFLGKKQHLLSFDCHHFWLFVSYFFPISYSWCWRYLGTCPKPLFSRDHDKLLFTRINSGFQSLRPQKNPQNPIKSQENPTKPHKIPGYPVNSMVQWLKSLGKLRTSRCCPSSWRPSQASELPDPSGNSPSGKNITGGTPSLVVFWEITFVCICICI